MQKKYNKVIRLYKSVNYTFFFINQNKYVVILRKNYDKQFLEIPKFFGIDNNTTNKFRINIYSFFSKKLKVFVRLFLKKWLNYKGICRKVLDFKILGYRISINKDERSLDLKFGFSHIVNIFFVNYKFLIKIKLKKKKLLVEGTNKHEVINFTKKIRALREPDPYKGKGIKYKNELITLKKKRKKRNK